MPSRFDTLFLEVSARKNSRFIASSVVEAFEKLSVDNGDDICLVPYNIITIDVDTGLSEPDIEALKDLKNLFRNHNSNVKKFYEVKEKGEAREIIPTRIYRQRPDHFDVLKTRNDASMLLNPELYRKFWKKIGLPEQRLENPPMPPLPSSGVTDIHASHLEDYIVKEPNVQTAMNNVYGKNWKLSPGNLVVNVDESDNTTDIHLTNGFEFRFPISKRATTVFWRNSLTDEMREFLNYVKRKYDFDVRKDDGKLPFTKDILNNRFLTRGNRTCLSFDGSKYFVIMRPSLFYEKRPHNIISTNIELKPFSVNKYFNRPMKTRSSECILQQPAKYDICNVRESDVVGSLVGIQGAFDPRTNLENFMFKSPNLWACWIKQVERKLIEKSICWGQTNVPGIKYRLPKIQHYLVVDGNTIADPDFVDPQKMKESISEMKNPFDGIPETAYRMYAWRFNPIERYNSPNVMIAYRRGFFKKAPEDKQNKISFVITDINHFKKAPYQIMSDDQYGECKARNSRIASSGIESKSKNDKDRDDNDDELSDHSDSEDESDDDDFKGPEFYRTNKAAQEPASQTEEEKSLAIEDEKEAVGHEDDAEFNFKNFKQTNKFKKGLKKKQKDNVLDIENHFTKLQEEIKDKWTIRAFLAAGETGVVFTAQEVKEENVGFGRRQAVIKISKFTEDSSVEPETEHKIQEKFYPFAPKIYMTRQFKDGEDTYVIIVMEKLGESLLDYLTKERSDEEIDKVIDDLKEYLIFAKRSKLTHGDLALFNLAFRRSNKKLIPFDFDRASSEYDKFIDVYFLIYNFCHVEGTVGHEKLFQKNLIENEEQAEFIEANLERLYTASKKFFDFAEIDRVPKDNLEEALTAKANDYFKRHNMSTI